MQIKAKTEHTVLVDDRRAIAFMGPELRVYGTPSMIEDMEMACRNLLLESLPEGEDSVGTRGYLIDPQTDVLQSHQSPGSAFKFFTYVTAFERGSAGMAGR